MPNHMSKPMTACAGPSCEGCSSPDCYAGGGKVKGVHAPMDKSTGISSAGSHVRASQKEQPQWSSYSKDRHLDEAKDEHRQVLREMKSMKKPELYAKGGEVEDSSRMSGKSGMVRGDIESNQNQKGVNQKGNHGSSGGISEAGQHIRNREYASEKRKPELRSSAVESHKQTLSDLKGMKKPNLYAEGGEVEATIEMPEHDDMEEELKSALGDELMSAFERKDRKGIMSGLEALICSIMAKE